LGAATNIKSWRIGFEKKTSSGRLGLLKKHLGVSFQRQRKFDKQKVRKVGKVGTCEKYGFPFSRE
jgi:hypothetical protein